MTCLKQWQIKLNSFWFFNVEIYRTILCITYWCFFLKKCSEQFKVYIYFFCYTLMGHFKSPSFPDTVNFYLNLVQAKPSDFLQMRSLSRNWKLKDRDCDETYRRSDGARYCTRCAQGVIFVQIVIIELQPAGI